MTHKTSETNLLLLGLVFILAGLAVQGGAESDGEPDFARLDLLVVQNEGIEKSLRTYAGEQVRLIAGRSEIGGKRGAAALFALISEPVRYAHEPLFEASEENLRRFFGGRRISLHDYLRAQETPEIAQLLRESRAAARSWRVLGERAQALSEAGRRLAIVPQVDFRGRRTSWIAPHAVMTNGAKATDAELAVAAAWAAALAAVQSGDATAFSSAADALIAAQKECAGFEFVSERRIRWDRANTAFRPFYWSAWLYLAAAILFVVSLVRQTKGMRRSAALTLAMAFLLHVGGLVGRGVVLGRAPVASLYESLTFAAAGSSLLALVLQSSCRRLYPGLGGALLGAFVMGMANALPTSMTRANPLIAALQSYWLAIHVTTVMVSYSAFSLSFFFCVVYLAKCVRCRRAAAASCANVRGLGQDAVRAPTRKSDLDLIESLNLKTVCFGLPMLTVGIVTGAVWANTAWGRPWGWDPKETWAAVTWLIYILFLHLRFLAGWSGAKSMAVCAVGYAAVLFTYFGVSYLLPGLHSYF